MLISENLVRIYRKRGRPLFSISLLTYNCLDHLKECLKSIEKARDEVPFELIITDNGSTDGTDHWLYENYYFGFQPEAKLILNDSNLGFIAAHRSALEEAKGKYFIVLNDDVTVGKNWLKSLLEAFISDPKLMIAGPHGSKLNESGLGARNNDDYDFIQGCCLCILTSFAKSIGLWAEEFENGYAEDSDLCLRTRSMGFHVKRVDFPFNHVGFVSNSKTETDVKGFHVKNHYYLRKKWGTYLKTKKFHEKIVIKRGGARGDVFLLEPVISHLKRENVHREITVATHCEYMLQNNPDVSRFVSDDFIIPEGRVEQAGTTYYDLDMSYERRPGMHITNAYAEALGLDDFRLRAPRFHLTDAQRQWSNEIKHHGAKGNVVLHAGVTPWKGRRLPLETFEEVCKELRSQGYGLVEVGDHQQLRNIDEAYINRFWWKVAGVIRRAAGFVGIDSAPMHIAQGYEIPSVVAFGCIDPRQRVVNHNITRAVRVKGMGCLGCHHWKGIESRHNRDCIRGDEECMTKLTPEDVLEAFKVVTGWKRCSMYL